MNLEGNQTLKTFYAVDENTGVLTVTFKDETEVTTLGTISIEKRRFRSMLESLAEVGRYYFPDIDTVNNEDHRTTFIGEEDKATTEFG